MTTRAFEAIIQNGMIRLPDNFVLPNNTRVHVVLSDVRDHPEARIPTPHVANPYQAGEFRKQVLELPPDANL